MTQEDFTTLLMAFEVRATALQSKLKANKTDHLGLYCTQAKLEENAFSQGMIRDLAKGLKGGTA